MNPTRSDRNKKAADLHQVGGLFPGEFYVTRTRESHPRFLSYLDGTLASPPPGCRARFNGQLLMLKTIKLHSGKITRDKNAHFRLLAEPTYLQILGMS